jgi:hypothetical protein
MPKISFYRQKRVDGGVRTGVEVNDNTVLSSFASGDLKNEDPALLWYVDVDCQGRQLPADCEEARQWLGDHKKEIATLIESLAEKLRAGKDHNQWPVYIEKAVRGVKVRVSCSAVRRMEARNLASILGNIAEKWDDYVGGLAAPQEVS